MQANDGRSRAVMSGAFGALFSSLLALSREGAAQTPALDGVWIPGWNHDTTAPNATDYMAAFPNGTALSAPGGFFGWGDEPGPNTLAGSFNAIHMALIPKGPNRGKVIVWNRLPVIVQPGAPFSATDWWSCQGWSILDPSPNAPQPRFRNFLLPVTNLGPTQPVATARIEDLGSLFCTGHAWSAQGNLVVAGGGAFDYDPPPGGTTEDGAKFLFMFDPERVSHVQSSVVISNLYVGEFGWWREPPLGLNKDLTVDRYYPTVTLTHRLVRTNLIETVLISGGSNATYAYGSLPGNGNPLNTFESFSVRDSAHLLFLERNTWLNQVVFEGPGVTTNIVQDWLGEYPRQHLLEDGWVFFSGPAWEGARLDPENPPITLGAWDYASGRSGYAWTGYRHDGSALFLSSPNGLGDIVIRLGGYAPGVAATDSVEYTAPLNPGSPWKPVGSGVMPGGARAFSNAVLLPDESIVVAGGNPVAPNTPSTYVRYTPSAGWARPQLPIPTYRDYHATMLLVPDGRVLMGGGNQRHLVLHEHPTPHDYDLYEPPYLHSGQPRPTNVKLQGLALTGGPDPHYVVAPGQVGIHVTCAIDGMASLAKAVLIAPGSITHHSDMSARFVELHRSVVVSANEIVVDIPAETVAPRGYHMLFAVSSGGTPSEAIWVRIQ